MPILVAHRSVDPSTGEATWHRWASGKGFASTPASDPPHTVWKPRVIDGGNYERHAFGSGRSRGRSTFAAGEIVLNNADRGLSYLRFHVLSGQPLEIRRGARTAATYPDDFPLFLAGVVAKVRWERRRLVLELADVQADFADRLLVTATFAGSNALPAGLEGTPDDVGGKHLSQPYAQVRNATLSIVNTEELIGQVAARAVRTVALQAVEDGGSPYTAGAVYADLATLESTAPAAGAYRFYPGLAAVPAYARVGTEPELGLTADILEGAAASDRTAAQVMRRMLLDVGVAAGKIEGVDALDTRNPEIVGWWTGPEGSRAGDALDAIAGSVGAWWVGSRLGAVALGRLEAPKPIPDRTFEAWEILDLETLPTEDDEPIGHLSLEYQANWTVQTPDQLAEVALVDLAERAWRAQQFRTVTTGRDEAIFALYPGARTVTWRTYLDTAAAAAAELARLARLYAVPRPTHRMRVAADRALGLDVGLTVGVDHPLLGSSTGIRAVILGEVVGLARNRVTFCLWGAEKWT